MTYHWNSVPGAGPNPWQMWSSPEHNTLFALLLHYRAFIPTMYTCFRPSKLATQHSYIGRDITIFRCITMFCGTNNIPHNISKFFPHWAHLISTHQQKKFELERFLRTVITRLGCMSLECIITIAMTLAVVRDASGRPPHSERMFTRFAWATAPISTN